MPLYRFRCHHCQALQDLFSRVDDRDAPVECPRCQQLMTREIAAPMVRGDYPGYDCPRTGKWIEGRRAHVENLKLHGCRVLEPGEKNALDKRKRGEAAALDLAIEDTVEELIHTMPTRKREDLAIDLQNGANVEVLRGDGLPTMKA